MLTHKGTQTIKTERLILRRFTPDDAQNMYNNWANDERVTKYMTWTPHESAEATLELIKLWCTEYERENNYNWVIEFEGTIIGSISVVGFSEHDKHASIGYCLAYKHWNKGFMPECAKAVIDFLFSEIGFNRIEISHAVKNPASGRVAQKCGLTFEGTKRQYLKSNYGEYLDISFHSILKSEWEALRTEETK